MSDADTPSPDPAGRAPAPAPGGPDPRPSAEPTGAADAAGGRHRRHGRHRDEHHRDPDPANNPRFPHPIFFLVLVVVVTLLALAIHRIEPGQPGAFYTPPNPLPTTAPGQVIRTEPITGAPAGSQGWTVLYQSTGMHGEPIAVSGVVFAPTGPTPAGGRKVVAWAHPTTGVASRCAPSLQPGGGGSRIPGLAQFLAAGYVVAATDYPGLGTPGPHPYLVGESEGRAVVDSVRAAAAMPETGAGTTYAVWGHSQGGQAALFAGQVAGTDYGRGLQLAGVAAAAPATDLSALLQKDIGGVAGNVLGSMAVVSWSQVYADQGVELQQVVDVEAAPFAKLIADYCIETNAQLLVDLPEAVVLRVSFLSNPPWSTPPWDSLLAQNTPGAAPIPAPVLVNQGTADTIVWPSVTASWVQGQCAKGAVVTEHVYEGVTHTLIGFDSEPDTAAWIADRFAGAPAATACSTATLPVPANPPTPGS